MASSISAGTTSSTALVATADTTGILALQTNNGTTALTLNASQAIGVGSTPSFGTSGQVLTSGGSTAAPTWASSSATAITNGTSNVSISSSNGAIAASTNGTSALNITTGQILQFNSGYGSVASAYGCRAWVNFNGTGTVAIRSSANVSSITDDGTGLYTANFTTSMPDVNYAAVGTCNFEVDVGIPFNTRTLATGSAGMETYRPAPYNTPIDVSTIGFAVFR